ncbi:ABC transporter ATP-binding protein [Gemmatimonas sp.]|uniref:ABC transporter ATP-binding protein n=1 Tax=Gemmatimonas sp. TaxID=1962908 RepID=UPI003565A685
MRNLRLSSEQAETQSLLRCLADLFPHGERWRLTVVFIASVAVALFETIGVASILPFMAVLMDPSSIDRYAIVRRLVESVGATSPTEKVFVLGALVGAALFVSSAASVFALWIQQKQAARTQSRLTVTLFDAFLHQPYEFHVMNDASFLQNLLYHDVSAVGRLTSAALQFTSRVSVVLALIMLLLFQSPSVALTAMLVIGGSYFVIYRMIRGKQSSIGHRVSRAQDERHRAAQEGLAGVKELQVLGREAQAVTRFDTHASVIADANAKSMVLGAAPRFLLEPIAFGGILAVALYLFVESGSTAATVIPTLALYAFVGYRLLPAAQQIYASIMEARFAEPAVRKLHLVYVAVLKTDVRKNANGIEPSRSTLKGDLLELSEVGFTYANSARPALSEITLTIEHGESIGLVGRSGSGKTTLADILLGLCVPQQGDVFTPVGRLSNATVRDWRKLVGYVPQSVFLTNASVRENIALGLPLEEIDNVAVYEAARLAQATEFIESLPNGFDTVVGERGVALSGGQRQRIGIARALFVNPELLVFDEATSALDGVTEAAVMNAIHSLRGTRTVVIIAHRLQTIKACDRLLVLSEGRLVFDGSVAAAGRDSLHFRQLLTAYESSDVDSEDVKLNRVAS